MVIAGVTSFAITTVWAVGLVGRRCRSLPHGVMASLGHSYIPWTLSTHSTREGIYTHDSRSYFAHKKTEVQQKHRKLRQFWRGLGVAQLVFRDQPGGQLQSDCQRQRLAAIFDSNKRRKLIGW